MRIRNPEGTRPAIFSRLAYSMIEVLVAVTVLGIMFVSLYSGISSGFAVIQLARENLRATQILQEKMETIRLYTWDQINTPGFVPTNFVENFFTVGTNVSGLSYTGRVTITSTPFSASYSNELKSVKVRLQWASAKIVRTREIETLVTRQGLQNYVY
ncbi:MAG: type IV pilus modification PilV family protein [Limisphaerales bacterium]